MSLKMLPLLTVTSASRETFCDLEPRFDEREITPGRVDAAGCFFLERVEDIDIGWEAKTGQVTTGRKYRVRRITDVESGVTTLKAIDSLAPSR